MRFSLPTKSFLESDFHSLSKFIFINLALLTPSQTDHPDLRSVDLLPELLWSEIVDPQGRAISRLKFWMSSGNFIENFHGF